MSANDRQEGGSHYRKGLQHWDVIKHWMTPEQYEGYLLGSASKYLARYNEKDGPGGVKKSIHYLEKLLEFIEERKKEPKMTEESIPKPVDIIPVMAKQKSSLFYTYEGGYMDSDIYRCKHCRKQFSIPVGDFPEYHHPYTECQNKLSEGHPSSNYVNQDRE